MPTLTINDEQVFSLIEQLSPEQKEQIFQILLLQKQQKTWETLSQKGQIQIKKIAEEKNKNWEAMTEEEREDFINDLIHEDRQCD
jgi:hypothetical protein